MKGKIIDEINNIASLADILANISVNNVNNKSNKPKGKTEKAAEKKKTVDYRKTAVGYRKTFDYKETNKDYKETNKDYEKNKTFDYKARFYEQSLNSSLIRLKDYLWSLSQYRKGNEDLLVKIFCLSNELKNDEKLVKSVNKLKALVEKLIIPSLPQSQPKKELKLKYPKIPEEIREGVFLDIKELEKSYNSGCFRAAIILCGRILEACLHRKYYDATGFDILEKNPGIGLGSLIAKLREKNINFDPGLANQIHLLNEARIFSVHKKKEAFLPSQQQTYAMILYTVDIVERLF